VSSLLERGLVDATDDLLEQWTLDESPKPNTVLPLEVLAKLGQLLGGSEAQVGSIGIEGLDGDHRSDRS
jgi:hypothetical protein